MSTLISYFSGVLLCLFIWDILFLFLFPHFGCCSLYVCFCVLGWVALSHDLGRVALHSRCPCGAQWHSHPGHPSKTLQVIPYMDYAYLPFVGVHLLLSFYCCRQVNWRDLSQGSSRTGHDYSGGSTMQGPKTWGRTHFSRVLVPANLPLESVAHGCHFPFIFYFIYVGLFSLSFSWWI